MPLLLAPKPKIARVEAFGSLAFEQERHQRTDLYSRIASFHSFCDAEHSDANTVFLQQSRTPNRRRKMNKQWEPERSRVEHTNDARITLTIALHGDHAWEMFLEDSNSYHTISHGWATDNPHDWEALIAPALRRLFLDGRLRFATKVPIDAADGTAAGVPLYDPPLCSPATRAEDNLSDGWRKHAIAA
jgi:hypothetical protein